MITTRNFAPGNAGVIFLQRCLGSDLRLHISLAATQRSPNTSVAMRAKM
jgi:hypothetical protein